MAGSSLKQQVAALLGERRWDQLKVLRDKLVTEPRLRRQPLVDITIGTIPIRVPASHPVVRFQREQPYRDLPVGITAGAVGRKYPEASFVDVGANVGDTAAMMASHAGNPLILVDASDYYLAILEDNARRLPNVRRIEPVLVATDDTPVAGRLRHWGGTAALETGGDRTIGMTKPLAAVADPDTRFVKIDTDGYDYAILRSSMTWLGQARPLVLFESDVSTPELHAQWLDAFDALGAAGYTSYVIWDDRGHHMATTEDLDVVLSLHRWLHQRRVARRPANAVYNFDILCAGPSDRDVVKIVSEKYAALS